MFIYNQTFVLWFYALAGRSQRTSRSSLTWWAAFFVDLHSLPAGSFAALLLLRKERGIEMASPWRIAGWC